MESLQGSRRIVYPLLLVAILAAVVVRIRGPRARRAATTTSGPVAPTPVPVARPAVPVLDEWQVASTLARDPFELGPALDATAPRRNSVGAAVPPPAAPRAVTPPTAPRVQILLLDPKRPLAIVESRRVAVGDTVGGHRVAAIDARGVTFEWNGTLRIVRP